MTHVVRLGFAGMMLLLASCGERTASQPASGSSQGSEQVQSSVGGESLDDTAPETQNASTSEATNTSTCESGYQVITRVPLPCPLVRVVERAIEVPSQIQLQVDCPEQVTSYAMLTVRDARDPQSGDMLHHDTPYEPDAFRAGSCEEYAIQGDETIAAWSVRGVAVWDAQNGSLLHTLQVEGDTVVPRTENPDRLLSLAFAEDVIYLFTETALLVVEKCGDGPWLEETDAWRYRGPALSLSDAIGVCS